VTEDKKKDHFDKPLLAITVRDLLKALKLDQTGQHFIGTPERVARMYMELCYGLTPEAERRKKHIFHSIFDSENEEMVTIRKIRSVSLCPHHLLPVEYKSFMGYVPRKKVIGLSKVPRLFKLMSSRPIIQEDLTQEIGRALVEHLEPKGVGVVMVGVHACMRCRGVLEDGADVITSFVDGVFRDPKEKARDEFLTFIKPYLGSS